jgi:hypothetical protein
VIDGNYSAVRDLVWGAADTVVILAYRRLTVMRRVIARSLSRMITRRPLWNGNRESLSSLLSRNPEENIVLWSWTTHQKNLDRYLEAVSDPEWAHLRFVRFTHPHQSTDFLNAPA